MLTERGNGLAEVAKREETSREEPGAPTLGEANRETLKGSKAQERMEPPERKGGDR